METKRCSICGGTDIRGTDASHRACARREQMAAWIERLGFGASHDIAIPSVSDAAYEQRSMRGVHGFAMELFVQPPEDAIPFSALLKRLHHLHWTTEPGVFRERITWEPTDRWRWFWMEVSDVCPRVEILPASVDARMLRSANRYARMSVHAQQTLDVWRREGCVGTRAFRVCSFEEYVIAFFAMQDTERALDVSSAVRTVLRTRCNSGVLLVNGYRQRLSVSSSAWALAECYQRQRGIRVAEAVAV